MNKMFLETNDPHFEFEKMSRYENKLLQLFRRQIKKLIVFHFILAIITNGFLKNYFTTKISIKLENKNISIIMCVCVVICRSLSGS